MAETMFVGIYGGIKSFQGVFGGAGRRRSTAGKWKRLIFGETK